MVEQYDEVLPDQETPAETPEHRSPSTSPGQNLDSNKY